MNRTLGCVLAMVLLPAALAAKEPPAPATPASIDKLIADLDADQFGQREAASVKLRALGRPAVPALEKAALGDSLEVTCRAIDVLVKLAQSTDESTQSAAKAALARLAQSGHGTAAPRAAAATKPKPDKMLPAGNLIVAGGGNIVVGANVVVGGAGARRVSVTQRNGTKQIEAEEDGRKVKIDQDAQGAIKMEVTRKKDGRDVTEKYAAKDAAELKKKYPQAHELYQRYQQNVRQATATITIHGIGGVPGNLPNIQILPGPPVPVPAAPGAIAPTPAAAKNSAEMAAGVLRGLTPHLQRLTGKEQIEAASPESRAELKKQVAELKRHLTDLERRLDAQPAQSGGKAPASK